MRRHSPTHGDSRHSLDRPMSGFKESLERSMSEIDEDSEADSEEGYEPRFTKVKFSEIIVFLPFNPLWKSILMCLITCLYSITIYELVFLPNTQLPWMNGMKHVCHVAYLIDTIAAIIHKKNRSVAALRNHKPRPIWLIVIDGFTLLPFQLTVDFTSSSNLRTEVRTLMLLVACIRVYRIYTYFEEISQSVGLNPWTNVLENFSIFLFLLTHTSACAWYWFNGGKDGIWSQDRGSTEKWEKPEEWYLICFYYVNTVGTSTGLGDFFSNTLVEHWITLLTMLLGFTLITGLFCGAMTDVLVQTYRRHSIFWNKLRLIQLDLSTSTEPFSSIMIEKVMTFYMKFWEEKGAIKESHILKTLPTQMICEVQVDMYWNAINGCRLFRDLDISYKREVAKYMEFECFMEGDIILNQGALKCKMIYVVQGVIQILSKEDSESPLIALSAGTCLGETSLLLSYPSAVEINAATYCELQMLDKRKLIHLIREHPQIGRKIYEQHFEQVSQALHDVAEKHLKNIDSKLTNTRALEELKLALRHREEIKNREPPFSWMTEYEKEELLSKEEKQALLPRKETRAEIILDQYRLTKSVKLETDDVCLETHWPWVFNPNSNIISIWNWIIVVTVTIACILIPYYVCFERHYINDVKIFLIIIDILYWFDLYLQLTTAVCVHGEFTTSIRQIMLAKLKKFRFITDVIATIPINLLATSVFDFGSPLKCEVFRLNRILRVHRVMMMFDQLQNGPLWDNTAVRIVKYIICLLMGSFWMGAVFYMQACFFDETCKDSWVEQLAHNDQLPLQSFYFAVVVISGTGYGDIIPVNEKERLVMLLFYIVGVLLFSYLVSDYSGMLILKDVPRISFSERVFAISRFLDVNHMDASIRNRVNKFLLLQWNHRRGYFIMNDLPLFSDAPEAMKNSIIIWRRKCFFLGMDLFKGTDIKLIEKLCLVAESYALPPNEIVTFAGEICREFYIIEEGFCESTSNLWSDVGVVGPYTSFNDSEMIFGIPGFHNVRTITHCKLLRVTQRSFKLILSQFAHFKEILYKLKAEHLLDERTIPSVRQHRIIPVDDGSDAIEPSWIVHRASTRQHPNKDYDKPFLDLNIFAFIKFVLLKRTLYPSGKFFIWWEVSRSIFALISGLLFPPLAEMRTMCPELGYLARFLDFTAYIDLYVRMHVCYYNKEGILISHPWYTCKHYFSHGFALDLIACFPFEFMFGSDGSNVLSQNIKVQNYLRLNRTLQLHRITSLVSYWEQDILIQYKYLKHMKYVPLTLVLINVLTCVYVWQHSFYRKTEDGVIHFVPVEDTWLKKFEKGDFFSFDLANAVDVYIISCYWISATLFNIGYGDIVPLSYSEMMYSLVVILFGYIILTYVTVRISSTYAIYNRNLTLYQEHMHHLINFTKREKISRYLRREISEHFENVWQKTRGLRPFQMFEKFHIQLKEDAAMFLYERTLKLNTLFSGIEKSFFRRLVVLVRERYFANGAEVSTIHDFVTNVHFVHHGELNVFDSRSEKREVLKRGHIFGNLERHRGVRLKIPLVASTNVILLVISSETFFKLVDDYPVISIRLKEKGEDEIMRYNFDNQLIQTELLHESTSQAQLSQSDFIQGLSKLAPVLYLALMICSYLSCGLITYHLAFEPKTTSLWVLVSSYTLDVFLLLRFFLGFFAPFQNDMGDLVVDPYLIKKNYMKDIFGFWLDVVASFPLELLALAAPEDDRFLALACLRTIHLLRVFHIVKFFNIRFERLDVNVRLYKASYLGLWFTLLGHFSSCIFYMTACPMQTCIPGSWAEKITNICGTSYFTCSIFFTVEVFTTSGLGNVGPRTQVEMAYAIFLSILVRFAIAIFIGSISAIVANYSYTLVNYNFETNILKDYLKSNPICGPLINKVLQYVQLMWKEEKGRQVPAFLVKTPPYLLARFNTEAYGKHLYENYIFSACDGDFLRQLIVFLRRYTFFPGNFVTQQGDMDSSIYFIHTGEVEVIAIGENSMELIDVLENGDTFGLSQGLHKNLPHDYTYLASAVTVILTLKYEDWEHLLKYFPGTRSDILSRIYNVIQPVIRII